jgi:hypothetical protein
MAWEIQTQLARRGGTQGLPLAPRRMYARTLTARPRRSALRAMLDAEREEKKQAFAPLPAVPRLYILTAAPDFFTQIFSYCSTAVF